MRMIGFFLVGMLSLGACQTTVNPTIERNRATLEEPPAKQDVLRLTNRYRAEAGLPPLQPDDQLRTAAALHSADLSRHGRFSHSGSDGSGVGDRVLRQGYQYCVAAENIAIGQVAPDEVLKDWMMSPGHRQNILDRNVTDIGVHREGDLWVMVLASRC